MAISGISYFFQAIGSKYNSCHDSLGQFCSAGANFVPSANLQQAFSSYTQLTDFTKTGLLELLDTPEMKELSRYTQEKLKEKRPNLWVSYKTQNLSNYQLQKGAEINRGDASSWTYGQGPREYRNYQYEVIANLPHNKVLASAEITPDLFSIPSEKEIISKSTRLKVTSVQKRTDDKGDVIYPIQVYVDVVG